MEVVARLNNEIRARQLVDYLRASGIPATMSGGLLDAGGPIVGAFAGQFTVLVVRREALGSARELARVYLEEMPDLDASWEDDAEPDLTKLHPSLLPDCPACGYQLLRLPDGSLCPACRRPLDLVELVIARHGPEALAECCGVPSAVVVDDEAVRAMDLPCPRCRYSLSGLERQGRCPECGAPYDKVPPSW